MNKLVIKLIVVKSTQIYVEWNSSETENPSLWHTQYTHTYIHTCKYEKYERGTCLFFLFEATPYTQAVLQTHLKL